MLFQNCLQNIFQRTFYNMNSAFIAKVQRSVQEEKCKMNVLEVISITICFPFFLFLSFLVTSFSTFPFQRSHYFPCIQCFFFFLKIIMDHIGCLVDESISMLLSLNVEEVKYHYVGMGSGKSTFLTSGNQVSPEQLL